MYEIDLNCDLGESYGSYRLGNDEAIMKNISSANIACGFHAGDPVIMRKTVLLALEYGVNIGAHPGFPDLNGFGRREMSVSAEEAYSMVIYQIGALDAIVKSESGKLKHVKPHGALYNMCARNSILAEAVANAVYRVNPELILFGLAGSELIKAGEKMGLSVSNEVFADRTYQSDGTLSPRNHSNAVICDDQTALSQVLEMIKESKVTSVEGIKIPIKAETICLHGDGERAIEFAELITAKLQNEGIVIKAK